VCVRACVRACVCEACRYVHVYTVVHFVCAGVACEHIIGR